MDFVHSSRRAAAIFRNMRPAMQGDLFLEDFRKGAVHVERFSRESAFDVLLRDKTWTEVATFMVKAQPFSFELLKGRYCVGWETVGT